MNNDAPNPPPPNAVCNNQIVMEYNANRLEMLGCAMKLRRFLVMPSEQTNELRNEILTIFREFARAFPNAGLGEMEGLQMFLRLGQAAVPQSTTEFALAIAPHQPLVNAFRRLREYI